MDGPTSTATWFLDGLTSTSTFFLDGPPSTSTQLLCGQLQNLPSSWTIQLQHLPGFCVVHLQHLSGSWMVQLQYLPVHGQSNFNIILVPGQSNLTFEESYAIWCDSDSQIHNRKLGISVQNSQFYSLSFLWKKKHDLMWNCWPFYNKLLTWKHLWKSLNLAKFVILLLYTTQLQSCKIHNFTPKNSRF